MTKLNTSKQVFNYSLIPQYLEFAKHYEITVEILDDLDYDKCQVSYEANCDDPICEKLTLVCPFEISPEVLKSFIIKTGLSSITELSLNHTVTEQSCRKMISVFIKTWTEVFIFRLDNPDHKVTSAIIIKIRSMPALESFSIACCSDVSDALDSHNSYDFTKLKVLGVPHNVKLSDKDLQKMFGRELMVIRT